MIQRVNMKGANSKSWMESNFFLVSKVKLSFTSGVFSSKEFTLQGFPNSCGLKNLIPVAKCRGKFPSSLCESQKSRNTSHQKGKWTVMRSGKNQASSTPSFFLKGTFSPKIAARTKGGNFAGEQEGKPRHEGRHYIQLKESYYTIFLRLVLLVYWEICYFRKIMGLPARVVTIL